MVHIPEHLKMMIFFVIWYVLILGVAWKKILKKCIQIFGTVNIFCNINPRNLKWSIIKTPKKDLSMIFNFNRMNGFFASTCSVPKTSFCRIASSTYVIAWSSCICMINFSKCTRNYFHWNATVSTTLYQLHNDVKSTCCQVRPKVVRDLGPPKSIQSEMGKTWTKV